MLPSPLEVDSSASVADMEFNAIMSDSYVLDLLRKYELLSDDDPAKRDYRLAINRRIRSLLWLAAQTEAIASGLMIDDDGKVDVCQDAPESRGYDGDE